MPIKGLTDNVIPRFPRLGKLRKGGEKKPNGGYGADLDHFRFTSENPAIVQAFSDAYGDNPVSLHVYLPYPQVDANFATWKEAWTAGGLMHRCDGETCQIWRTPQGKYSQEPKPCPGGCDEIGRLTVILPELIKAGFVGYVTLETHSLHDMMNMTATLLAVAQERVNDPRGLQGIEFVLRRKKEKISTPGDGGKRVTREKWLVSLEPVASWAATYLALAGSTMLAIEAPANVDPETGEVLDDSVIDAPAPRIVVEQPKAQPAATVTGNGATAKPNGATQQAQAQAANGNGLPFAGTKRAAVDWAMQYAPQVWPVNEQGFIVRQVVERSFDNCQKTSGATGEALAHAWIAKIDDKLADYQRAQANRITDAELDGDTDTDPVTAGDFIETPLFS